VTISPSGATAYVVNTISGTLTPIATDSDHPGTPILIGTYAYPLAMAITPDGRTAEVVDNYAGKVTTINLATRRRTAVEVGEYPSAIVIASPG